MPTTLRPAESGPPATSLAYHPPAPTGTGSRSSVGATNDPPTLEEWAAEKGTHPALLAGARALRGWASDKRVDESTFDDALAELSAAEMR